MNGDHVALDAAVWFHDDQPLAPPVVLSLSRNDVTVIRINFRNEDGNILGHAVGGVVGDHRKALRRIVHLQLSYRLFLHVHGREDHGAPVRRSIHIAGVFHDHVSYRLRDIGRHVPPPGDRIPVRLSPRARRRGHASHLKPWMLIQQPDVVLTDHPRRTDDTYPDFLRHDRFLLFVFHC